MYVCACVEDPGTKGSEDVYKDRMLSEDPTIRGSEGTRVIRDSEDPMIYDGEFRRSPGCEDSEDPNFWIFTRIEDYVKSEDRTRSSHEW
jgi:hypothetical protein